MKKLLMLIFLAGAVNAAVAQEKPKTRTKPAADLNLTEQQDKQLKDINRSYMNSAKALRSDSSLTKENKKAKYEALNTERNSKIKSVLDKDQYAKWESYRKTSHERMSRSRKPHHGRDEAIKSLGLNEQQGKEMKSINKDFMSKASALRENKELTKEQRQDEMKKLFTDRQAKLKTTLGDEKFAQYDEMQKKKGEKFKKMRKDRAPKPNVQ